MHLRTCSIAVNDMGNIEITKRELLASIIIVLLLASVGFFISTSIHNKVSVGNEKYFKALKVDNNPEMFGYALKTNVGDVLAYGKFKANEPVSDPLIKGEYFSLIKAEEHYVMKTRTVTTTDDDGNVETKTEIYWEWDEMFRETHNTPTFQYLGEDFKYKTIKFRQHSYIEKVSKGRGTNVRWKFYGIPTEFNAALFFKAKDGSITEPTLHLNKKIQSILESKEKEADMWVVVFWVFWVLLIALAVFGFVALDNRFINNEG